MTYDLQLPDVQGLTVALDTETSGLFVDPGENGNARVSVVTLAWWEYGKIASRCYAFDQGVLDKTDLPRQVTQGGLFDDQAPNLPVEAWDEMVAWLLQQWLVFHNAKFDLHIMRAGHRKWGHGVDLSNRVLWDTQVVNAQLFPLLPTSLKPTSVRLWGDDEDASKRRLDQWLKKHGYRFDLAPWELIGPYATEDAEKTIRLFDHQMQMIECGESPVPWRVLDREVDRAVALFRMECRGVGFDVEGCRQAAILLGKEVDQLSRQITLAWSRKPTPAAARAWFGIESAEMQHVAVLVDKGVPWAAEYQRLASWQSALSKWYTAWPAMAGDDGRLRPSYHQAKMSGVQGKGRGTVSGRLAVERIQLHAIPHDFRHTLPEGVPSVRSFFQAAPGNELWEIDIAQAEVRVATHLAKCEPMRQVLVAGDDVHGQTARKVFGITPDHPEWDKYRTLAKRLTFATIYKSGPKTFQLTLRREAGIIESLDQCRAWLDDYRAAFPQLGVLERRCTRTVEGRGWLRMPTGKLRWFSPEEIRFRAYKGMNQLVQGSVADAMAIIEIQVEMHHPGVLLNEVHDSLMVEVPAGEAGRLKVYEIELLMLEVLQTLFGGWVKGRPVPWKVDSKQWNEAA